MVGGCYVFSSFLEVASWGNLSLQYVNSNIEFLKLGLGVNDGWVVGDVPNMHNMVCKGVVGHGISILGGRRCMG